MVFICSLKWSEKKCTQNSDGGKILGFGHLEDRGDRGITEKSIL
jgi:hypothetical protein